VSNSDFSELAGTTTHGILVAVDAPSGIEDWSKSTISIVRLLVYQLVVGCLIPLLTLCEPGFWLRVEYQNRMALRLRIPARFR
jgi:hypothetical protein